MKKKKGCDIERTEKGLHYENQEDGPLLVLQREQRIHRRTGQVSHTAYNLLLDGDSLSLNMEEGTVYVGRNENGKLIYFPLPGDIRAQLAQVINSLPS